MMNNDKSLEQKFNQMADEADGGGSADPGRERKIRAARGKIISYIEADDEMKRRMNQLMKPIDDRPDSFEAIVGYGHPPLEQLGRIADQMIKVQGKFTEQVNVMAGALDKLESGMKGMNFDKFGENVRNMLSSFGGGVAKTGKGIGKGIKAVWEGITGTAKKRTEDQKLVEQMQDQLPEMLAEMNRLVANIKETRTGIELVIKEAEKLGQARVETTREIGVYLGAKDEVLRRYDEEYIPEAEGNFKETADPEDEIVFKNIVKRKEDFIGQVNLLEASRLQSVNAAKQLQIMIETMETQLKKVDSILNNEQHEWKALLAAAGIAGSSLKAAQSIEKAGEFGDKLLDQSMMMMDEAQRMTLEAISRGSVDPRKLIQMADNMQKMIEREQTERVSRLKTLEASGEQMRAAADRLLDVADSASRARLLEAAEEAREATEARHKKDGVPEGAPANDDKKQQPEAALPDVRPESRKKRDAGPGPG